MSGLLVLWMVTTIAALWFFTWCLVESMRDDDENNGLTPGAIDREDNRA